MHVQNILSSKGDSAVITVKPDDAISDVAQVMAERRIGGVIVSRNGDDIVGILSERDIVRSLALRGAVCLQEKAQDMMTRNPTCCRREDTSDAVLQRMTDGRFRHMPVVEDQTLVGIVTIGDVVKARLQELAMEKDALEGMVKGW
ncbi:MAG: CBS domain-containing protein [Sediminimonas qiaohouensis]|uniref:CBS domain-containing protein n=1 Tax=Sediminimonas qiaohouensis TaxID=552061 RepID=A0A7C9HM88_9RHOB|nr:CBS domain-containing protein [Sediminimonas qiaohouensis]MTJ04323.1 CBS domain-containing protein [Sediminimonas qiaohouensis]